jgi:membrane fusion protein, multidrug efflux system
MQLQSSLRLSVTEWVRDYVLQRRKLLVASLAILVSIAAVWFIRESVLYERTDNAQIDGKIMPLSASINGYVQQIDVIEGQMVHAGDVLAVLDQKEYSIAVYQATANLAYAENTAASLYYGVAITVTTAYGGLSSAQSAVKNAQAEVAAAENKLRADEAVRKHVQESDAQVTIVEAVVAADQQVLVETQKELMQAVSQLRDAQTAPQQASLAKVKAEAADSQVLQCKAQLEQAQLNLNNTIIRSPATGIVGKRRIEVGQNVKVGQELIDVVSLDDVWITANFKQTQLVHLRPGQPVEIKVDAYGRTWKGHVTNLGGGASSVFSAMPLKGAIVNDVKGMPRVPVRIDFDRPDIQGFNTEDLLKPGLSVEPKVRVRWLPRARPPNSVLGGPASILAPTGF